MTLRNKTVLIVGGILVTLLVIMYITSRLIVLNSFVGLERDISERNVHRVLDSMSASLSALDGEAGDWASWDESYAFMNNRNNNFIKRNPTDNAFSELRLSVMLFVNLSGELVFGKAFDLQDGKEAPVPAGIRKYIAPSSLLLRHTNAESSIAGIVVLPEGPMLVASRPVLASQGKGPIRGTLIFGRYLDRQEIRRLAEMTHLSLDFALPDNPDIPRDFQAARHRLSEKKPIVIQPVNAQTISGYALLKDVYGRPALMLRVNMNRNIYRQGRDIIFYFTLWFIAIGLVLAIVTIILLQKQVLARVTSLIRNVGMVGASGDLSRRVQLTGEDEISRLSDEINKMLGALERANIDLRDSEEKFRAISDTANDTIILMDDDGNISFWNEAATRTFGYSVQEVLGKDLHNLLVPSRHRDAFRKGFHDFMQAGKGKMIGRTYEFSALRKDGKEFPVELSISAVILKGKWNAIGIIRDITRRKQAAEALEESEEKYRTLVENINIGVYRSTAAGRFLHANAAMAKMFGYESIGEFTNISMVDLYENAEERKLFIEKIGQQGFVKSEERKFRRKDGISIWGSVTAKVHYGPEGQIEWIDGVIEDVTERKRMEEALRALSLRDELTGLYNRRGFLTLAEQQLKVADRVKKGMLLIFADLDGMKEINDTLGHPEGDRALIDVGYILKKTFRESDIIARFGGDEFVVLSLETPESSADILTERLSEHMTYHNRYENRPYKLSVSTGIARYDPENPLSLHDLLIRADRKMYENKKDKKR
jgi:diguanylate cyclase (GGDEF)-like protein/PAS domain S-box-containing protein